MRLRQHREHDQRKGAEKRGMAEVMQPGHDDRMVGQGHEQRQREQMLRLTISSHRAGEEGSDPWRGQTPLVGV